MKPARAAMDWNAPPAGRPAAAENERRWPDGRPLRVARLCSVFEPPAGTGAEATAFDPIGGMQFHTGQLTRALDTLGVQQVVVTAWRPGAPRDQALGRRGRVLRLGVPVSRFRQLYSLPAARILPRLTASADVLHAHLGEDLAIVPLAVYAVRQHRRPLVLTVHCSLRHTVTTTGVRDGILGLVGGRFEVWGEATADAVVVLTGRLATTLERQGVDRRRIHVIPSGVDPTIFREAEDPLPDLPRPRILFVGRLARQKGVRYLLEAVRELRTTAPVVVVGDGPARDELERTADRLGVHGRVRFTGFVPHDAVPAFLQHADVLVLPSLYEELGSVLVEAMAAALPTVVTRVGGIPEVVVEGESGLLVPPRDPSALASGIDRVLGDPELAGRLKAGARRRAEDHDWATLAQRVLTVYRTVLAGADGVAAGAQ